MHKRYLTSSPGIGTYSPSMSEICTNKSSPPERGVMKPCPLLRLKLFTTPVSIGFAKALADVDAVLVRLVVTGLGNCRSELLSDRFGELSGEDILLELINKTKSLEKRKVVNL